MHNSLSVLMAFSLLLGLMLSVQAQTETLNAISTSCQQREQWSNDKTFVWDVEIRATRFPNQPTQTTGRDSQQGDKSRFKSVLKIAKRNPVIKVEIMLPTFKPTQSEVQAAGSKLETLHLNGNESIRFSQMMKKGAANPPTQVWTCPGDCRRYFDPVEMIFRPDLYIFVAAENPLPMYQSDWSVKGDSDNTVTVVGKNPVGFKPELDRRFELQLSRERGFYPKKLEVFEGTEKKPGIIVETRSWEKIEGRWIPNEIYLKITTGIKNPIAITEYYFKLASVSKTSTLEVGLPKGERMSDFRLTSDTFFSKPNYWQHRLSNDQVDYNWTGTLPTQLELRQMAFQQGKLGGSSSNRRFSIWLLAPGVALILGGCLYYLRVRRDSGEP
ncbi:MAG: hypothetical protein KIT45_12035 [Fimbriimonadia bacterium]|nr:hypothetical protein [Fimbriimonadia bacterium]